MAQQVITIGTNPNDDTGELLRAGGSKINNNFTELYALNSSTINAAAVDYNFSGATIVQRIDLAVADGVLRNADAVYIPASMLPFDVSLVTNIAAFHAIGGKLIREGGNPDVYDVRAYGATANGIADDFAAQQAAINGIPANGGVVHYPATTAAYMTGSEIVVPADRVVTMRGDGAFTTNQGFLSSFGSIIRRLGSYTTGPLMSQRSTLGFSKYGVQMYNLGFDGNNLAGDLLYLYKCALVTIEDCVFFNSNGNGLYTEDFQNSYVGNCHFYELGNSTAFPNGKSAFVINSTGAGGNQANTVLIDNCQWESGRGSYLTAHALGASPVTLVTIIGGKMEMSGNSQVGFPPSPAPAVPLAVLEGLWFTVRGTVTVGGYHTSATHWRLQNIGQSSFDVLCIVGNGLTDAQNPRFLVDLFSGTGNVEIKGTFINGASISAGTGAQIRVVESSMAGYHISPDCQFINPISGVGVGYINPTTGKSTRKQISGALQEKSFSLTGAVSTAINANDGNYCPITIGSNIAVVAAIPTNPPPTGQSQELVIEFFNNSGGALSTAPTFTTGTNGFLLPGTITNPANGTSVIYSFRWSGIRSKWLPVGTPQAAGV